MPRYHSDPTPHHSSGKAGDKSALWKVPLNQKGRPAFSSPEPGDRGRDRCTNDLAATHAFPPSSLSGLLLPARSFLQFFTNVLFLCLPALVIPLASLACEGSHVHVDAQANVYAFLLICLFESSFQTQPGTLREGSKTISPLHKPLAYLEPQYEKREMTEKSGMKLAARDFFCKTGYHRRLFELLLGLRSPHGGEGLVALVNLPSTVCTGKPGAFQKAPPDLEEVGSVPSALEL